MDTDTLLLKKTLPHSLEAERALLGSILVNNEKLSDVRSIISPGDFYKGTHEVIFVNMIAMADRGEPIDLVTLTSTLGTTQLEEIGGGTYISRLTDGVPRSMNVEHYARMVKTHSVSRDIINRTAQVIASSYGRDGNPIQVLDKLQTEINELSNKARQIKEPRQSLSEYLKEKYEQEKKRKPDHLLGYRLAGRDSGFLEIQKNIDGLQWGLYFVAAYTNRGKTAFLTSLCLNVLLSNPDVTVMYISLDDSKRTIVNRLLSIITGISINAVQKEQKEEKDRDKLQEAYRDLEQYVDDERLIIMDIEDIEHINDLQFEIGKRANSNLVVFIDDVYNLEIGGSYSGLREENVDRAIRIKKLVEIYDIPIICSAELRKKATGDATNKKPSIHDIMETGKFGYKADLVWLLYPDKEEEFEEQEMPVLTLKYAKNKLSDFNETQPLVFIKAQGMITEKGSGARTKLGY